ncbi:hypothetical protein NW768_001846 [Fusarium equiseti]|uniref:Nucleoside phosphorylase domain-containing protein n=1 Tax=Fusarium equiseti TaxID=61235 RepID=A0ABQ8RM75_FUSEQ|nr:hypothetical protein NW768_001846 [Fusarium equiseti]
MDRPRMSISGDHTLPHQRKRRRIDPQSSRNDSLYGIYTVAWICALPVEMAASRAMLDEEHDDLPRHPGDNNSYILGAIQKHNIVMVCLPLNDYGTNSSAHVLSNTMRTFPNVRIGLIVGIVGEVPSKTDTRLGDIVVGARVVEFDFGRSVRKVVPNVLASSATAASFLSRKNHVRRSLYRVGIICALPKELMAVRALFDETHPSLKKNKDDTNTYALGKMGLHHVVATCLAEYGTNNAAVVAVHMKRSFKLRFCLLVGIGGGVPSARHDIRLGDVVVGKYVVQYDLGKETEDEGFQRKNQPLQTPPLFLKTAFRSLHSDPDLPTNPLDSYLRTILSKERTSHYGYPGSELDIMFNSCSKCSSLTEPCSRTRTCERRADPIPKIHYGGIASGNSVIANAQLRDRQATELDVACFEMEAAGIVDAVSCLVIRGICDYCDGQKTDDWQEYAAATAASFAKLFLGVVDEEDDDDVEDGNYDHLLNLKRHREETP